MPSPPASTATAPTRILGLDPGSYRVGYAVVEDLGLGRARYVECGTLTAPRGAPIQTRLVGLAADLREVLAELAPDVAAVEDVFQHRNARSALVLGQARGAALLVLGEHGLPLFAYPPARVKKAITGSGRAAKEQVHRVLVQLLGLRRLPAPDAGDALSIAVCHCLLGPREARPGADPDATRGRSQTPQPSTETP